SALEAHCMGESDMCTPTGLDLTHHARGQANVATVISIASALAIGGGVYLYLSAPTGHKPMRARPKERPTPPGTPGTPPKPTAPAKPSTPAPAPAAPTPPAKTAPPPPPAKTVYIVPVIDSHSGGFVIGGSF